MNYFFWPNLYINLFSIFYFFNILKQKKIKILYLFFTIIIIHFFNDIFFEFFKTNEIIAIFDILVFNVYLIWFKSYKEINKIDYSIIFINSIIFIFLILNIAFNFIHFSSFIISIFVICLFFYLLILMIKVSQYNTNNAEIIISSRYILFFTYLFLHLFIIFFSKNMFFIHFILIPLSYFLVIYFINFYFNSIVENKDNVIKRYSTELDDMFLFIKNFSGLLSEKLNIENALQLIVDFAVANTNADAGAVLLVDDFKNELLVKAINGDFPPVYKVSEKVKTRLDLIKSYFINTPIKIGETILGESAKTGQSLFIKDTVIDKRLEYNIDDTILYISSIIVMPLIIDDKVIGLITTVKKAYGSYFSERDFNHLKTFARYGSIYISNMKSYIEILEKKEMQKELGIAAEIQDQLLPKNYSDYQFMDIAVHSKPAKGVSGDYYDIIKINDELVFFVVCDVAGKGVPASMVMIIIRTIIHLIITKTMYPKEILKWVNEGLKRHNMIENFATMSIVLMDFKNRKIIYSNAAHLPMIYYNNKNNKYFNIDTNGLPLGIENNVKYQQKIFSMNKDDLLFLYTDGIIEAMNSNGDQYKKESLLKIINKNIKQSPKEIIGSINDDLKLFIGNEKQYDDQTLLIIKFK